MSCIPLIRLALICASALMLAACQSTFARRDTIGYAPGDAVAWNKAVHTIDPWPATSNDTAIPVSGRKVAAAIERYETHGDVPPPLQTPAALVPVVPIPPGAGP
jgi:hypothetical protein